MESQVYALNKDGSLTVVTVTASGSATSDVTPLALFDTQTYLLIDYRGVSHGGEQCNFVAARKADGALYCVTAPGVATPTSPSARTRTGASCSRTRRGTSCGSTTTRASRCSTCATRTTPRR